MLRHDKIFGKRSIKRVSNIFQFGADLHSPTSSSLTFRGTRSSVEMLKGYMARERLGTPALLTRTRKTSATFDFGINVPLTMMQQIPSWKRKQWLCHQALMNNMIKKTLTLLSLTLKEQDLKSRTSWIKIFARNRLSLLQNKVQNSLTYTSSSEVAGCVAWSARPRYGATIRSRCIDTHSFITAKVVDGIAFINICKRPGRYAPFSTNAITWSQSFWRHIKLNPAS